jgi:hypothetical protein
MSDKKHIDRLFQEKLKDFEATPNDIVWEKIHGRLHEEKRKRRIIPLWWKLTGVAALLALLFTVGIHLTSNDIDSKTTNSVVDTEKQLPNKSNEVIIPDSENSSQSDSKYLDDIQNQIDRSSNVATENGSNSEDVTNDNYKETSNNKSDTNRFNQKTTAVSESNKNGIAVNKDKSDSNVDGSQEKLNKDRILNGYPKDNKTSNTKNAVVNVSKNDENKSNQDNIENKLEKLEIDKLINDSKNDTDSKVTNTSEKIENIISEEKKEDTEKDKSIEEAIAEATTEDEKEKEKKLNRWNISPNVAPVYFNSLGKGSSIDAQFVDNSKSSEINMSYGVGGSYALNDRLKVRAGINKVQMGYDTNNVIAFRSIDSISNARGKLKNVSMNNSAQNMTFISAESLNRNNTPEIINSKLQGSLTQRFGFIEVPLEVEYALINNKLGVNVIGGFSTLIVDKNDIYSVIDGTETRIGEANNINNLSYSANFGLGVNYNISEKIKINVEPTFKYQINTFNNSSGDFQPYFIGVYTGLSYKF